MAVRLNAAEKPEKACEMLCSTRDNSGFDLHLQPFSKQGGADFVSPQCLATSCLLPVDGVWISGFS